MSTYLRSCGLLLLPIFVWNAVLTRYLPRAWSSAEFWRDIPRHLPMWKMRFG